MERTGSGSQASGGSAPSLFERIKRVVTGLGAFMDINGYRKAMARYENELQDRNS